MNITEPFVLQRDVLLIPCADLSDDVRARLSFEEGDYTLSVQHGRTLAQVIDGETAALLALFREPRTIVDAVIENSRAISRDPHERLGELLPHLGAFVENRVLVQPGSDDEEELRTQYESGGAFAGWTIVRCASLMEDSEVYQLRRGDEVAALKIARGDSSGIREVFENEVAILRHLDGSGIAPRLIEEGTSDGRPYMVLEWCGGLDASVAAAQRRHDRAEAIELCASIAAAYAALHARGVIHSDVHPRNVLAEEKVVLLDFGYACFVDRHPPLGRVGVGYYFEPEHHLPASAAGEQYSVAALLYYLITGQYYIDFRYDREEMVKQIDSEAPMPFAARGIPPWPEVERILFRALEKDPSRRFASMAEMAGSLALVRDAALRESREAPVSTQATRLLETTLHAFARGGAMYISGYTQAPTASINYGCAGAAVGLLRIAETRGDPALVALADVWHSRGVALIGTAGAYYNDELGLQAEALGEVTPYHTEPGIHAAGAMIAAARGEQFAADDCVQAFLRASRKPCDELDLTLGRSGSLLAAALLLEIADSSELRAFGSETMTAIWTELDKRPVIGEGEGETSLGMAHGWCGYLYAALRWCAVSGDPVPSRLVDRLHEYVPLKTVRGRGIFWRPTLDAAEPDGMPGWCNGSAGQVFLFTLAHRVLGDEQWLEIAERSAWNNWDEERVRTVLCCGTAGRAYALLNFYKHTGATEWLGRARQLANHAAAHGAASAARPSSLWKGELGVAVLIADLASPESARMPFFE